MTFVIQDGRSGRTATVDNSNRLTTFSSVQGEETTAALTGDTFTGNTNRITLTSANESALLYVKNTDTVPWIMSRVFANVGASTGGTGDWTFKIKKDVKTGTIVSAGVVVIPQNLNFGSAKELVSTVLKGVEGSTATNGTDVIESLIPTASTRVLIANNPLIIEQGATAVGTITPPAGNTSFPVQVGFVVSRFTGEV